MKVVFLLIIFGAGIFIWWLSSTLKDYSTSTSDRIEETHANQVRLLQSAANR